MTPYKNLGGSSGIAAYAIAETSIEVMFKDGWRYLYTFASAGVECIERMKQLAVQGMGLNSFISRVVKKRYASKR